MPALWLRSLVLVLVPLLLVQCDRPAPRRWLAGDSHVHSHWSPGYDRTQDPPVPIVGGDAIYTTPVNALMARRFGLSWMVTTDHGGPNHSKLNMTQAYEELKASRELVPEVFQFYGMELNMPAMDHHTLIVPQTDDEWSVLFEIESRFDANDAWPPESTRHTEAARLAALDYMKTLSRVPVLFANHPSRSATAIGEYGLDEPWEIRANHDRAPDVYRGMEGGPGHQAATLAADGTPRVDQTGQPQGARGAYRNRAAPTLGGFDQMTAIVGGLWDALLGEGRRFWIVATSDSHVHYTEPRDGRLGSDFWPGEFHKTYVYAEEAYDDVLDGLRQGRIFAVAGDLISELDVVAQTSTDRAEAGQTLRIGPSDPVELVIALTDPDGANAGGHNPAVTRVDVIVGQVDGPTPDPHRDRNETTRVIARFTDGEWERVGDRVTMTTTLPASAVDTYVRVRGTSTQDAEPTPDEIGENPWDDLWFYSNPIFLEVE